jgi:hypothetical protein
MEDLPVMPAAKYVVDLTEEERERCSNVSGRGSPALVRWLGPIPCSWLMKATATVR